MHLKPNTLKTQLKPTEPYPPNTALVSPFQWAGATICQVTQAKNLKIHPPIKINKFILKKIIKIHPLVLSFSHSIANPSANPSALPSKYISHVTICCCCCSIAHSCLTICNPHGLQHARSPCPSPSPGACSNSCPLNQWCHPTISSSSVPFSFCLQSFPASGSLPMSQLFASGGQSIGVSVSAFSSVQFSRSVVSNSLQPHESQHARPPPVHHQLPEFTQTHVHRVSDAIQPSHPLLSPSPPAPNPSQHQSLLQWVNSSHEVAKILEFQLQHHSLQRNPRADLLQNGLVGSPCSPRDSQESSPTPQFKSINSCSISPSKEYLGVISFRIDWFHFLAVQGTLKSLLQHHNSKASILWHSAFFMVQLSHYYCKNHSFDYMDSLLLSYYI